jgi:two-component system nitrogen regulation sensor histidine kinase NtrY
LAPNIKRLKARLIYFFILFIVFLASGLITARISFQPDSPQAMAERVAASLADELEMIEGELSPLLNQPFDVITALATETTYPFFVYDKNRLKYWSDNTFIPPSQFLADSFSVKLLRIGREAYILKKDFIDKNHYVISLITLLREYTISNDYLNQEWNKEIFPSQNFNILEPHASLGVPVCIGDNCVFRISFIVADFPARQNMRLASIIFITLSLVALLLLVYSQLPVIRRKSPESGLIFLLLVFLGLRWLMTYFQFPGTLLRSEFFDPQVFASSSINSSLGDLFLNVLAILALCFYVFKNYFRFRILHVRHNRPVAWIISVVSGLCILFAWLFPFIVIQTLYNNSSIILDISQSLHFDGLRILALLTVLLAGISSFLFSHAFISILCGDKDNIRAILSFLIAIVLFTLINEWSLQEYISTLISATVNFLIVLFLRLYKNLKRLSYGTFAYLFVSIFFLSANGAYAIQHFTHKEKIQNHFRFASTFLIDRDIFAEYLLNEASEKIASDAFIQTRLMSPFLGKEPIRQKIRQLFLPSYFNKYDVQIFIFNSFGASVDNSEVALSELVSRYQQDPFRTEYENIYFVTNPETDITQKYLMLVPIRRLSTIHGMWLLNYR